MKTVTLDVRPDLLEGREPFSRIMETVEGLGPEDSLLLIAPFQPVPLYRVLAQKGLEGKATPMESGDWEVLFSRKKGATKPKLEAAEPSAPRVSEGGKRDIAVSVIEVDVRGLEPPEPMVRILEAVERAGERGVVRAVTDRKPLHLYDELQARGWQAETTAGADGSFTSLIRKAT